MEQLDYVLVKNIMIDGISNMIRSVYDLNERHPKLFPSKEVLEETLSVLDKTKDGLYEVLNRYKDTQEVNPIAKLDSNGIKITSL